MINVIQNNDIYEVRFAYNTDILEMVRNIPGRRWVPEQKYWIIPKDKLGFLINAVEGSAYAGQMYVKSEEDLNVNATYNVSAPIPEVTIDES